MNRRIYQNVAKATLAILAFGVVLSTLYFWQNGWRLEVRPTKVWLSGRHYFDCPEQSLIYTTSFGCFRREGADRDIPQHVSIVTFGIFRLTKGDISLVRDSDFGQELLDTYKK